LVQYETSKLTSTRVRYFGNGWVYAEIFDMISPSMTRPPYSLSSILPFVRQSLRGRSNFSYADLCGAWTALQHFEMSSCATDPPLSDASSKASSFRVVRDSPTTRLQLGPVEPMCTFGPSISNKLSGSPSAAPALPLTYLGA